MPEFLPDIALALLWIGGGILIVLLAPALARLAIRPEADEPESGYHYGVATRDLGQTVGFRVSALYGVILALVYAQELTAYGDVRDGIAEEAVRVLSIWNDAERYGGPSAPVIRSALRDYVVIVVDKEWDLLGTERRLAEQAADARERAVTVALDLQPATPRETWLRQHMLDQLAAISRLRHLRGELALERSASVFWVPAIFGLALVSAPFFIFAPTRANRLIMASFGAFAGLVLFFIAAFANPYKAPLRMTPTPFEHMLANEMAPTAGRERP